MRTFFVNTDAISYDGVSRHDEWVRRSVVVTGGESKYREALFRIPAGSLVLAYVNGIGVVAIGKTLHGDVLDVVPPNTINPAEPLEYHKRVSWHLDIRSNPISRAELIELLGQGPLQAVQEVNRGKDALLKRIATLEATPTKDAKAYILQASALLSYGPINRPSGAQVPHQTEVQVTHFYRDPKVRAWTLQRAKGCCELCDRPAAFVDEDQQPYLESHHITMLSNGGPDTPENTAALCANCHRELHFGVERRSKGQQLRVVIAAREAAIG